jgi:hypothetical protein
MGPGFESQRVHSQKPPFLGGFFHLYDQSLFPILSNTMLI